MSTETVRVTGAIGMPNGQPFVSTKFKFELTKAGVDPSSNTIIPATPVTVTSSSSGAIAVDLWPNDRGFGNTLYKVTAVIGGADVHIGEIQVLQDGTNKIGEMLAITDYKQIDAELVGIENALRAEAAATEAQQNANDVAPDQIEARAIEGALADASFLNVWKDPFAREVDEYGDLIAPLVFWCASDQRVSLDDMTVFEHNSPEIPAELTMCHGVNAVRGRVNAIRVTVSQIDPVAECQLMANNGSVGGVTAGFCQVFAETDGLSLGGADLEQGQLYEDVAQYNPSQSHFGAPKLTVVGVTRKVWIVCPFAVAGQMPDGQRPVSFFGDNIAVGVMS